MIIMGIDPGTAKTGYGFIETELTGPMTLIDYGRIVTSKDNLMSERLLKIYDSSIALIEKYSPDILVIERLFFNTNVKTALSVGQARGIHVLIAGRFKIPVYEYTALEAKLALTGYGRSEKEAVRDKVAEYLGEDILKKKGIDASDALAMAICHRIKIS